MLLIIKRKMNFSPSSLCNFPPVFFHLGIQVRVGLQCPLVVVNGDLIMYYLRMKLQ